MALSRVLLLLVICLWSAFAFATSPYLVADLNPHPGPVVHSRPYYLSRSALNGAALFVARGADREAALWRTDGTSAGTYVLLPLGSPTPDSAGVSSTFVAGNVMYLGTHQAEGFRIWKTDGTAAGTVPVSAPRTDVLLIVGVTEHGVLVLDHDLRELKLLKGAELVTLATLRTGNARSVSYAQLGKDLYYALETGLWKSDGTVAGTTKISSIPSARLVASGNRLFFEGSTTTTGRELWTSDGTSAGTQMVADLAPAAQSLFGQGSGLTAFGNGVLFLGARGEMGTSDGTAANTHVLLAGAVPRASAWFATVGSTVYFPFDDGRHGRELWRSDGTAAGTRMVSDASEGDSQIAALTGGATRVYYYSLDRGRYKLFESDGTEAGTHVVGRRSADALGTVSSELTLTTSGDRVFFAEETAVEGIEPWVYEAGGARPVANIAIESSGSSSPTSFFAGRDHVFFQATNAFWRTDGTAAGTAQVMLEEGGKALAVVGNDLYIARARASLWRTEGAVGEIRLTDFDRGYDSPMVHDMSVIGGHAYVRTDDGAGARLHVTDGTARKSLPLLENASSSLSRLVDLVGQAYLLAGRDNVLYTTNGTRETTRSVARANDGFTSALSTLIPFNGELYLFAEHHRDRAPVLWKFSGNVGHTEIVKRFPASAARNRPLTAVTPKQLLFTWQEPGRLNQLWKTDGTPEGTTMVREFASGSSGTTTLTELAALGERVVFSVDDGVHGAEPWVTDGTAAGTVLLRDIYSAGPSSPSSFVVADGLVYFSATDREHGSELWATDGTPEGTRLVADVLPGANSSRATPAVVWRDRLFFAASTPETGRELWALPLIDSAIVVDDLRVRESAGTANLAIRLTRPSNRTVSVEWRTADAAARAGRDYAAASGTVRFAPGETLRVISIPLLDNSDPGAMRAFTVRLENGTAAIQDAAGAVIIEDDDVRTDVMVSLVATGFRPVLQVTNAGPSAASNVEVCWAVVPQDGDLSCSGPRELAPGASFTTQVQAYGGSAETILARVSQWEPDSNPSNNEKAWNTSGTGFRSLYVDPAAPRAGQQGTLSVQFESADATAVTLTSSDPTVISVPGSVLIPGKASSVTTTFTALRAGTATITAKSAYHTVTVTVRVYGPTEAVLAIPVVKLEPTYDFMFGNRNVLSTRVVGITAGAAKPTGTVTFYDGAHALGTVLLVDGAAQLIVTTPTPGRRAFSVAYNGDATFAARRSPAVDVNVHLARPSIRVVAGDTAGVATVIVAGVAGQPPSGKVTVAEQGAPKQVSGPLAPHTDRSSSTRVTGLSANARTVTVTYTGDAYYGDATLTIAVEYMKRRPSRQ